MFKEYCKNCNTKITLETQPYKICLHISVHEII